MSYLIYYLSATLIIGGGASIFHTDPTDRWTARVLVLAGLLLLNYGVRL